MSEKEDNMIVGGMLAAAAGVTAVVLAESTLVAAAGIAVTAIGLTTAATANIQKETRKKSKNQKGD
ncbi:MAG: hypothetical protein IJ642_10750 [Oscillospiraceae bacterium]|nr:hypothetical protein [Oscillospiraceae bacterium]